MLVSPKTGRGAHTQIKRLQEILLHRLGKITVVWHAEPLISTQMECFACVEATHTLAKSFWHTHSIWIREQLQDEGCKLCRHCRIRDAL
jgi:hypothetical protein